MPSSLCRAPQKLTYDSFCEQELDEHSQTRLSARLMYVTADMKALQGYTRITGGSLGMFLSDDQRKYTEYPFSSLFDGARMEALHYRPRDKTRGPSVRRPIMAQRLLYNAFEPGRPNLHG